jgi:hypothetical protein
MAVLREAIWSCIQLAQDSQACRSLCSPNLHPIGAVVCALRRAIMNRNAYTDVHLINISLSGLTTYPALYHATIIS